MESRELNMGAIKKISVSGYKSIKNLENFTLNNLNVFIGANGVGKSNFIQIFTLLMNMCRENFQQYIMQNGGASMFLHNGIQQTKNIKIGFEFDSNSERSKGPNSYRFTLTPTVSDSFVMNEEKRYKEATWQSYGDVSSESRLKELKNEKRNGYDGVGYYIYDSISRWVVYHFHDTSIFSAMRSYESIEDNKYLRPDGKNLAPYLLKLKNSFPRVYQSIVNTLRLVMPFFDDFTLDKIEMGNEIKVKLSWKQKGSDYPMQPHHFSDGSIRFIALITALNQPEIPSTIIIDEPELGLHPEAIAILAEQIKIVSDSTQIILATQSPLLIDYFNVEDIITINRNNHASSFKRLNKEELEVWLEDYTLGELWKKNIIVGGTTYE